MLCDTSQHRCNEALEASGSNAGLIKIEEDLLELQADSAFARNLSERFLGRTWVADLRKSFNFSQGKSRQ